MAYLNGWQTALSRRLLWQTLVWGIALTALSVNPALAQLEEQGVARVNQLGNLEALLNICANGAEILSIIVVPELFAALVIALLMRRYRFAGWMAAFMILAPVFGLSNPILINTIGASMRDTSGASAAMIILVLVEIAVLIAMLLGFIALQFLPTIIAVRQHRSNKGLVIGLNLGGLFLPPLGIAAMCFALKQDDGAMPAG